MSSPGSFRGMQPCEREQQQQQEGGERVRLHQQVRGPPGQGRLWDQERGQSLRNPPMERKARGQARTKNGNALVLVRGGESPLLMVAMHCQRKASKEGEEDVERGCLQWGSGGRCRDEGDLSP